MSESIYTCQKCCAVDLDGGGYQEATDPRARCSCGVLAPIEERTLAALLRLVELVPARPAPIAEPVARLLTVDEACAALGCKRTRFFALKREGKLRTRRLGKRLMVTAESVDAVLAEPPAASNDRPQPAPRSFAEEVRLAQQVFLSPKKRAAGRRGGAG